MIKRTKEEIEAKVFEIWPGDYPGAHGLSAFKVEVSISEKEVRLNVHQMYNYVECGFPKQLALSEFFGTQNITMDQYSSGGCETCDYGSKYEVTFRIRPEKTP